MFWCKFLLITMKKFIPFPDLGSKLVDSWVLQPLDSNALLLVLHTLYRLNGMYTSRPSSCNACDSDCELDPAHISYKGKSLIEVRWWKVV